jgi:hypothetical protein
MRATTRDVIREGESNGAGDAIEDKDLISELIEACEEALKLRGLECTILTKKGVQPYEMQKFRDEAAGIERKIRAAIAKAKQTQSIHPVNHNEKETGKA